MNCKEKIEIFTSFTYCALRFPSLIEGLVSQGQTECTSDTRYEVGSRKTTTCRGREDNSGSDELLILMTVSQH